MSPREYTTCPRCKKKAKASDDKKRMALGNQYGKIPREEFERLCRAMDKVEPLEETLAIYEESGFDDNGKFTIRYDVACRECDFRFEFRAEQDAKV